MENTSVKGKDEATCFRCRMGVVQRGLKRFFDALGAVVAMIVFSPFFLVAYIAIKMEKTGPALFKQERIGKNGKPFLLYKFRTMTTDAENGKPKLYNTGGDDRLTKVGKFLREHHLDELPQLWNVLRGDMSMVGYRPERQYFIDKIMEHDHVMCSSTRCARVSSARRHSTTVTPIPWTRCSSACVWTSRTSTSAASGSIQKSFSSRRCLSLQERNSKKLLIFYAHKEP